MALSEHPSAQAWIKQFVLSSGDAKLAQLLLDSLHLVSHNEFQRELLDLVVNKAALCDGPVALYAIREVDPDTRYFRNKNAAPRALVEQRHVGSEGQLAYVINVLSSDGSGKYLNHPPLKTLKKKRCHNIFLIDDLCGSGQRAKKFIRSIYQHPTVKSWYSFRWITFHVIAYSSSFEASSLISSSLPRRAASEGIEVHYVRSSKYGTALWTEQVRVQVESLCRNYGAQFRLDPKYRTGYSGSFSTVVFEHRCPNNAPGVLWCTSKKSAWLPLFPNRTIPPELKSLFGGAVTEEQRQARVQELLGVQKPYAGPFGGGKYALEICLVLGAISKKHREAEAIAAATGLTLAISRKMLSLCHGSGFITKSNILTENGRNELRHARRSGIEPLEPPAFRDAYYFPKTLRSARGSSSAGCHLRWQHPGDLGGL